MSGEGWAPFVGAVLGRWHGAGPGRLEIPENPEILQAVERLAGQPAPARPRLLELLRRELERPLGQWLHPSWLLPCLPRDPLLRGWVLAGLPAEVRHPLLQALGGEAEGEPEEGVSVLAYQAPDGFGEWWNGELECLLAYPRPLPWSEEGASALGRLYRLSPRDLVRLLQFHGLRPLAAALASWGQERRDLVIAAAFHLPEILRRRLVELTQESSLAEVTATAWGARADRLRAGASRLATTEHLPTYLALAGVAANATASGRRDEARRVAYRLPRELGAALLAALGENLAELAAAGREAWDRGLEEDCAELARRGLLRWPEPWEGLP